MSKVKEKLIHWLGGFTKKEYDSALTKLTESHDALQASLRALEHAVENSRMTGRVNIVRTESLFILLKQRISFLKKPMNFILRMKLLSAQNSIWANNYFIL